MFVFKIMQHLKNSPADKNDPYEIKSDANGPGKTQRLTEFDDFRPPFVEVEKHAESSQYIDNTPNELHVAFYQGLIQPLPPGVCIGYRYPLSQPEVLISPQVPVNAHTAP